MVVDPKLQLDYRHAAPVWKRRTVRRWSICIAVLAMISVANFEWGKPGYRQCELYYRQRECPKYFAPADEIAYEDDPVEASKLLKKPDDYLLMGPSPPLTAVDQRPLRIWQDFSGETE